MRYFFLLILFCSCFTSEAVSSYKPTTKSIQKSRKFILGLLDFAKDTFPNQELREDDVVPEPNQIDTVFLTRPSDLEAYEAEVPGSDSIRSNSFKRARKMPVEDDGNWLYDPLNLKETFGDFEYLGLFSVGLYILSFLLSLIFGPLGLAVWLAACVLAILGWRRAYLYKLKGKWVSILALGLNVLTVLLVLFIYLLFLLFVLLIFI